MRESVGALLRNPLVGMLAAALFSSSVLCERAAAQTVVLNQAVTQVTDTTIRAGAYANTNFDSQPLITRRSITDPDWERRALIKVNTETYITSGARIASATLTLTVKSGLGTAGATRPLRALRIASGFLETDATWLCRMGASYWSTPGGDVAEQVGTANASNVPGSKVNIDLTSLVQRASDGILDTRYTRLLIQDIGGEGKESYREYYSSEDSTVSRRPTLTVVLGSGTTAPPPVPSGTTLKVMQWNIEQGRDIDGAVRWIAQIKPDVISFNEMMSYHLTTYANKIKAATGQNWTYKFEVIEGRGEIGVAVFSRLPIESEMAHQLSYMRSAQDIRISVNGRTINVTSTHLDHQSSSIRLQQVKELKAWLAGIQEQRIVAGDFNWYPGTTEINEMGLTYYDSWVMAKSTATAVSAASNPEGATRTHRIDYIWYSKGATALSVVSSQVYETGAVSDHRPVVTVFKVN